MTYFLTFKVTLPPLPAFFSPSPHPQTPTWVWAGSTPHLFSPAFSSPTGESLQLGSKEAEFALNAHKKKSH